MLCHYGLCPDGGGGSEVCVNERGYLSARVEKRSRRMNIGDGNPR